ncbi:long chain fatty acid coa ligase-like protein [Dermatophagoides farinae]|uniref:long-chain-fatty-acid--CoA ligase n=1 Tax=Dermatophagoides farinae TaxID=6954 RepID=A0A9D4SET3_DERFA|nr:long chain fatty acid coa ligase-like protein [Dermatophagoides farinae]
MENNTTTTYEQSNSNLNLNHDNRNVYPPLYLGTDSSMAETFINISNKIQTNNNSQHSNKYPKALKNASGIILKFIFMTIFISIVQIYTWTTWPLYFIVQQPWKAKRLNDRIRIKIFKGSNDSKMSPIYERNDPEILDYPFFSYKSVTQIFQSLTDHLDRDRNCLGYRQVLSEESILNDKGQERRMDGRKLKRYYLSDYKWITYGQAQTTTRNIAKGLMANGITEGDRIMIFAETRIEWMLSFLAIPQTGAVVVTAFSNLGTRGLLYSLEQTEVDTVIVSFECIQILQAVLANSSKHKVKRIIFMDGFKKPDFEFPSNIKIFSLNGIERLGEQCIKEMRDKPLYSGSLDRLMIIMYTSGTNGDPKAALITENQLFVSMKAMYCRVRSLVHETDKHIYVAYLPSAHILELTLELLFFLGGVRLGYASPFTLTDSAPGLGLGQKSDMKLLQPTIMTTVPLVLERILKEINEKLKARTPVSQQVFRFLANYKSEWTRHGYKCNIVTKLICPKVREQFGNKLMFMICGGAPLNTRTQATIKSALDVIFIQGYGCTETTSSPICMDFETLDYGNCGSILANAYFRLQDWDEGGYSVRDRPNPRGELLIGGEIVTMGYFKNPHLTKEVYYTDENRIRWYRTGDIAEMFPNGFVKIIDRRKDLIKLQNGEYISLGKVEAALKMCPLIENAFVYGDIYATELVALISPNQKAFEELSRQMDKNNMTIEEKCNDKQIESTFLEAIVDVSKQSSLTKIEIPKRIKIVPDVWSPDNDILTASMKLKRQNVMKKYNQELTKLCNERKISDNQDKNHNC